MSRKDLPPVRDRSFFRARAGITRCGIYTAIAVVLAGLLVLMLVNRYRCPFLWLTGVPCPGCGMTRALRCLLHGELRAACAYNPLVFVLPVYVFLILCDGRPFARRRWNRWLWGGLLLGTGLLYCLHL